MKSPALQQLLAASQRSPELQQALGQATTLQQIVAIAAAAGFAITSRELQLWAHDDALQSPWWPWAGRSEAERRAFFRGG